QPAVLHEEPAGRDSRLGVPAGEHAVSVPQRGADPKRRRDGLRCAVRTRRRGARPPAQPDGRADLHADGLRLDQRTPGDRPAYVLVFDNSVRYSASYRPNFSFQALVPYTFT